MRIVAIASSIVLLALVGCEEESDQPTGAEFQQERAALNERVAARKAEKASNRATPAAPASSPSQIAVVPKGSSPAAPASSPSQIAVAPKGSSPAAPASSPSQIAVAPKGSSPAAPASSPSQIAVAPTGPSVEDSLVGAGGGIVYDRDGLRDPFRSFMWKRKENVGLIAMGTPLEQFDVSQLSLIAVVWKTGSARALVEDPAGQSYIIAKGTRIGKNEGMVTVIDDNLVVVNETYEDYLGNVTKKDIEMRIRRSEGG